MVAHGEAQSLSPCHVSADGVYSSLLAPYSVLLTPYCTPHCTPHSSLLTVALLLTVLLWHMEKPNRFPHVTCQLMSWGQRLQMMNWQAVQCNASSVLLSHRNTTTHEDDLITDPITDPITNPITSPITGPITDPSPTLHRAHHRAHHQPHHRPHH